MKNLQQIYSAKDSEIFIFSIDQNISMLNSAIIPKEQLEKILKYKEDRDRVKRVLARTFLFEYCQKKYNLKDFAFEYTKNQKPKFKHSNLNFSISYSKNIIAIALSKKYIIGVDIEFLEPSTVSPKVASEFMNDKELTTFLQMNKNNRNRYFYEVWTTKESLLKAKGNGLSVNPKAVDNTLGNILYFKEYVINFTII